ncbi:DUF6193 family natural product biosynthesis protein [Streptomyces sp. NPDC002328]|uniref:DUF6193 family natural product biosynthesis protein n=1 Tax=Streptomyces sp. NPDC002328 TaxID=3364642 RepID=UPI0036C987E7
MLNGDLYPDLIRLGGLASAMSHTARTDSVDLGEIRTEPGRRGHGRFTAAALPADRGTVSVCLGADERWFSITIADDAHVWTTGGTDDLHQLVGVTDAWRRGATLRELHDRFPFMSCTAMAQAYEDGTPVVAQWERLLAHEEYVAERPLLRAAHAEPRLRTLFPVLSHGSLILSRDPYDRTSEEFRIIPRTDGGYRVGSTNPNGSEHEVTSLEEALVAVLILLGPAPS